MPFPRVPLALDWRSWLGRVLPFGGRKPKSSPGTFQSESSPQIARYPSQETHLEETLWKENQLLRVDREKSSTREVQEDVKILNADKAPSTSEPEDTDQGSGVKQQKLPLKEAQNGVQPPDVVHHEEPETAARPPDGAEQDMSQMKWKTLEETGNVWPSDIVQENPADVMHGLQLRKKMTAALDVQPSDIVQENPADVTHEQQPRKKITEALWSQDSRQEDLDAKEISEMAGGIRDSQTGQGHPTNVVHVQQPRKKIISTETLDDEQHQNDCRSPDVMQKTQPRKKNDQLLDDVLPADFVLDRQPRTKDDKALDDVQPMGSVQQRQPRKGQRRSE